MSKLPQTSRFDPSMCSDPKMVESFSQVCNGADACKQNLQQFCQTQIHTAKEFNTQTAVLNCTLQCGQDKKCRQQCGNLGN